MYLEEDDDEYDVVDGDDAVAGDVGEHVDDGDDDAAADGDDVDGDDVVGDVRL